MRRGALHFNALRAFESAARHLSFSRAADELSVTHSAISHQVRHLEERLGRALFVRTNRGVVLTEAGQTLLPVLADSFDRISATLEGLVENHDRGGVNVTTTPTFAAKWLIPRLADWSREHPDIPVHLDPTLEFSDLAGGAADIAVRCGTPPWDGVEADELSSIHLTPLCNGALAARLGRDPKPSDMLGLPLIHADIEGHEVGEEWRIWFAGAAVAVPAALGGLSFRDPNLALQAAIDGLGVAVGYLELAAPDLADGRLVRPYAQTARHPFSYYAVYRSERLREPSLAAFRAWLLDPDRQGWYAGGGANAPT